MNQGQSVEPILSEQNELFDNSNSSDVYSNLDIFNEYAKNVNFRNDQDFIAYAKANAWETRRERNFPWRMDVFDYLREVYGPWLGKGLTRADLKDVDEPLWWAINNRLRNAEMPEDINLPKDADAQLLSIDDPVKQAALLKARELNRARMQLVRSMK